MRGCESKDKEHNPSENVVGSTSSKSTSGPSSFTFDIELEEVSAAHLNNFFCNLPGGFYRSREVLDAAFQPGETFLEAFKRFQSLHPGGLSDSALIGYSKKKLDQSPGEFFSAIDEAVSACRVEAKWISDQISSICDPRLNGQRVKILESLNRAMLPVYFALRALGYSHRDLVG